MKKINFCKATTIILIINVILSIVLFFVVPDKIAIQWVGTSPSNAVDSYYVFLVPVLSVLFAFTGKPIFTMFLFRLWNRTNEHLVTYLNLCLQVVFLTCEIYIGLYNLCNFNVAISIILIVELMFNAVHTTDWHEPETLEHWREQWAAAVNTKFEEKGLDVRIDHRSYVRQGLDLIPTVHEGANVRQMEAKGIRTEKGELNRWIKATNRLMQDVRKKIKALFVWMAEVKEELSKPQTPSLADLLIAYYNQRNAGAWSNKARTGNLKQFAEAVNYLTENKLLTLEDLQERLSSVNEEFEALSDSMKKKSARIKELQELIREGENYQRLKPVHTELNNIKFKKQREKFETSHDAELRLFYAARRILKEKLDGKPIALKAWKQEYAQLKTEYAELSPQHKPLREEVIRLRQVQNAVDTALRRREQPQAVQRKKHEMEL